MTTTAQKLYILPKPVLTKKENNLNQNPFPHVAEHYRKFISFAQKGTFKEETVRTVQT